MLPIIIGILSVLLLSMCSIIINFRNFQSDEYMSDMANSIVTVAYVFIALATIAVYASPVLTCKYEGAGFVAVHLFVTSVCLACTGYFILYLKYGNPKSTDWTKSKDPTTGKDIYVHNQTKEIKNEDPNSSVTFKNMNSGIFWTCVVFLILSILNILYLFFRRRQEPLMARQVFIQQPQQSQQVVQNSEPVDVTTQEV